MSNRGSRHAMKPVKGVTAEGEHRYVLLLGLM